MRKRQFYHSFIAALYLIISTATPAVSAKTDTLRVNRVGKNNLVSINSKQMEDSCAELPGASVQGEIMQKGENNSVEIKTSSKKQKTNFKRQIPKDNQQTTNSKRQIANDKMLKSNSKQQRTNNKIKKTGEPSCVTKKNQIRVTQTGKNNSVKINSQ